MSPAPGSIPAVVLAGGRTTPEFAAAAGSDQRAWADINGWPMVRYVLHALRLSQSIGNVILTAPTGSPTEPLADEQITADGDLVQNMRAGLQRCASAEFALLVSADIPFLLPASIDDHVGRCLAEAADLYYAAIPQESCQKAFPDMKRTYLHSRDGVYTGGNLVLQRLSVFERQAPMVEAAYQARKDPARLVRLIGPGNVVKFALRSIRLAEIEQAGSRITGVRCRLVVTPHADLGTDVDKPADLLLARSALRPVTESDT